MAVIKKEDLITRLTAFIGEEQNDDAISLLEDVTDTVNDYETKTNDSTNWKSKYEENDKAWRQKYIDRFKGGVDSATDDTYVEDDTPTPMRYEDLFTVKEK